MTQKIDTLQDELADTEKQLTDTERAAAKADGEALGQLGGRISGLQARRKALWARIQEATGLQAVADKAHAAAVAQAERDALTARAVALEARWQTFLADVEATDTHAGALWADCRAMTAEYNTVSRLAAELGMPQFGADVLGMQGTPTLANAKNLQGNLCFHA